MTQQAPNDDQSVEKQGALRPNLEDIRLKLEIRALRRKTPLEISKLNFEIESLKKGFGRTLVTSVITAVVAVLIAGGGWLFDRMKTREADRITELQHQEERFSNAFSITSVTPI